jgi:pimeloyl-ACP methyl ester carboxylesterase
MVWLRFASGTNPAARSGRVRRAAALLAVLAVVAGASAVPAGCTRSSDARPAATPSVEPSLDQPASRIPVGAGCLTDAERAGEIRFPSRSGAVLAGVVLGNGRTGVVMAHGPHGDVCELAPYARVLARLGYRVLAFDFNGYGASGFGPQFPKLARLDLDVAAATAALRSAGVDRVMLLGAEIGGLGVVIAAAAVRPPVAGVIDLSSPDELAGMDGEAAAARLTVPSLFVTSAADFTVDQVRAMYAKVTAPDRELLVTSPDGLRGLSMVDPALDPNAARVREAIEDFLRRHAGG